jgi:hypothetical protein
VKPPQYPNDEARVVAAFVRYLEEQGWAIQPKVPGEWTDVIARRGDDLLLAEAKGRTSSSGLDIDTMFGQLLRRMSRASGARYAVVIPAELVRFVERVPADIRQRLEIEVFTVDLEGAVTHHESGSGYGPP